MKPIFISSLLTASMLATAAHAATPFDGPYVGAQAGYENFHADDDFTGAGVLAGTNASSSFNASGADGGIYAGYGRKLGQLYLGVEAEGDLGNADHSATSGTSSVKVEHRSSYGATARIGYLPTDSWLYYARLGMVRSKFDETASDTSVPFTAKDSVSLNGLRLGLGVESALTDHITARFDWAYTAYQDYDITYLVGGSSVGTEKISPSSNTFRLGLAYAF